MAKYTITWAYRLQCHRCSAIIFSSSPIETYLRLIKYIGPNDAFRRVAVHFHCFPAGCMYRFDLVAEKIIVPYPEFCQRRIVVFLGPMSKKRMFKRVMEGFIHNLARCIKWADEQ